MTTATATKTATPRPNSAAQLPFWMRGNRRPVRTAALSPREPRWWIAVVWLFLSVLLLGFVAHVTLFGILQHARFQATGYDALRTSLAGATTPTGQLDVNEKPVQVGTPIALLSIPRLGLNEVVRQGTTSDVTRMGVGHRRDTVMPGQAGTSIIYGRDATYGGPFGQLKTLAPGDKIIVTTGQKTFTFKVFGIRRPGDPQPVASSGGRLQLATADGIPLAPDSMVYVDASLVGTPGESPRAVMATQALDPSEMPMASNPSDWLPFVFALQWLAIAVVLARWLLNRWGRWQTWIIAIPVLLVLGAFTADAAMALLPNLL